MGNLYGKNDGMVVIEATGHGRYQTSPEALDLAIRRFSDATVNDLQWVMLERSDYELTYWDIETKSHLLVIWCDTLGLGDRADEPYYSERLGRLAQDVAYMDETGIGHGPSEAHIRRNQEWYGQFMANEVEESNLLSSTMYRACETYASKYGEIPWDEEMWRELADVSNDAQNAENGHLDASTGNLYLTGLVIGNLDIGV